ncbi:MAG: UDP-N-acetylmuramoyl-tripeptide--D-alanyl-D-alanine ligase, partial [Nocardioidaceae bacterium]|nr:UDP-N-acetylmuramoyl-tripeptide--D-alanyl-D-alanine ligase [Nocardioidaceae bacterium]
MIRLTLAEVAQIVGGTLDGDDADVTGPAFVDSRAVEPDGLFVAFAGERVDGHEYAARAVAEGAAGVLGSRPTGVPTVVVDDVQVALQTLAREVLVRRRARGPLDVVAITGSQGKTSAKDMLARVLSESAETVATYGSFNNEIGLPLTVLRVEELTRYLVLEMGARGIGHLTELCAIAPPDVAMVLNVGRAHLGEFGSRDAIARAKGELVEALGTDGVAVLNADDPRVAAMAARTRAAVWTFGRGDDATVRIRDVVLDDLGRPGFDLTHDTVTQHVQLGVLGEHHVGNAAAAVTAAIAVGVPFPAAVTALAKVTTLSKWRMELVEAPSGLRIVNEAYNANPDSMRDALETLAAIGNRTGAPTAAVLGEMLELGESSAEEHRAIGALVRELRIDHLVVVGDGARGILDGAAGWGSPLHAVDVRAAVDLVRETVPASSVVLVKASRGA